MKKLSKRKLNTLLKDLIDKLEQEHKDNFTGLVLFGSYAKNKATDTSDIDLILTFKNNFSVDPIEENIDLIINLELKYGVTISPIFLSEKNLTKNILFFEITDYAQILVDKNKKIKSLIDEIKSDYNNGFLKKLNRKNYSVIQFENV